MPDSYKSGIEYIKSLSREAAIQWLEGEVREMEHVLAGDAMSQPVQAIIDHYNYLSLESKANVIDAIESLVILWYIQVAKLPTKAVCNLLNLTGALHVVGVMRILKFKAEASDVIRPRRVRLTPKAH